MKLQKKYSDAGFTLIEVIVTIVVLALAAVMMAAYFGTAITRSADPIGRLQSSTNPTSAQQIMEKITLQYSQIPHWHRGTVYAAGAVIIPTATSQSAKGYQYTTISSGTSGADEPSWTLSGTPPIPLDGAITWTWNGAAPTLTDLQTSINTNQTTTVFGGNYTVNQNEFIKFDPTNSNTELTIASTDPAYGRYLKVRITDLNSPATTRAALFVLR